MSTAHTLEEVSVESRKTPLLKASMGERALGATASRDLQKEGKKNQCWPLYQRRADEEQSLQPPCR